MADAKEMIENYAHAPEEFPVLMQQTHKVLRDGKIVNERIGINENIIHYVQDTALLISVIDGSGGWKKSNGGSYDHVVYLDKSARPVSWLVNMFWDDFVAEDSKGNKIRRPKHSYVNIDRSPWFRNVGINVTDDGRQKENGELATYRDFVNNLHNLNERHLAELRALYIDGGIDMEDVEWIMEQPTILDGKRVLIVDEVSRTGATLNIATHLFKLAFPDVTEITGSYFWHPSEPILKIGEEMALTSLPVWYDPNTLTGRGIGGLDPIYYRKRYDYYLSQMEANPAIDIKKLRAHAFASSVYSAPLLNDDGTAMNLADEKKTRELCKDLRKLHDEYKEKKLFFNPPHDWIDTDRFEACLEEQGIKIIPKDADDNECMRIRKDSMFYLNFIQELKSMG